MCNGHRGGHLPPVEDDSDTCGEADASEEAGEDTAIAVFEVDALEVLARDIVIDDDDGVLVLEAEFVWA